MQRPLSKTTLLLKFLGYSFFWGDSKVAHNDFGTKLPNYQLSQVFSHFFWKMYRKSCQVTYFTKLLAFFGGKTLHKLPNFPNYRGFNFWERPKVAHIEPYLEVLTALFEIFNHPTPNGQITALPHNHFNIIDATQTNSGQLMRFMLFMQKSIKQRNWSW